MNRSIFFRLLINIILLYSLITLLITSVQFYFEYKKEKEAIKKELHILFQSNENSITTALWDMNTPQLKSNVQGMMKFNILKGVKILDKNNKVLINSFRKKYTKKDFMIKKEINRKVFGNNIKLGTLILISNNQVLKNRLKSNFELLVYNSLFKSLFLLFLIIFILRKYLFAPLQNIIYQINSLDIHNIEKVRIKYKSKKEDELFLLTNTVNQMLDKIEEQVSNLQKNEVYLQKEVDKRTKELLDINEELRKLAITDSLTKVYNRKKLDEDLVNELKKSKRYNYQVGVVLIDIDNFKSINDNYGHQVGDEVLKTIANLINKNIRSVDILGRWGGEEFLIICPQTNADGLLILTKKIRMIIENYDFPVIKNRTASFGISIYKHNQTVNNLIKNADDALYRAKKAGRNKVVIA